VKANAQHDIDQINAII